MLIAYKKRFLFVHIYKTAGTSVKRALSKYTVYPYESKLWLALQKVNLVPSSKTFHQHCHAWEIKKRLGHRLFDSCFKFAFVRNPWDLEVSRYAFILRGPGNLNHEIVKKMRGFEEYVQWRVKQRGGSPQKRFLVSPKGKLLVDFVGRFENVQRDFETVCRRLKIQAALPFSNGGRHKPYRECYSECTRRLIAHYHREDIEFFKYRFEGG